MLAQRSVEARSAPGKRSEAEKRAGPQPPQTTVPPTGARGGTGEFVGLSRTRLRRSREY